LRLSVGSIIFRIDNLTEYFLNVSEDDA
jgi:hypothetical protein